jgi:hypothetical protein
MEGPVLDEDITEDENDGEDGDGEDGGVDDEDKEEESSIEPLPSAQPQPKEPINLSLGSGWNMTLKKTAEKTERDDDETEEEDSVVGNTEVDICRSGLSPPISN